MNATQIDFFRKLCAPFAMRALFQKAAGGRTLTYLKAPTIMNRLDDVAGVDGWDVKYEETDRGYICTIGIRVPADDPGEEVWVYKSDGGGYEGMTKKAGGENIEDADNDEKSAYTNAFRRAAYAWGIGRYLWQAGVAEYLGDEPVIPELPAPPPPPPRQQQTEAPTQRQAPGGRPAPAGRPAPGRPAPQGGGGGGNYDNFAVPKSGRALFKWAKSLEEYYRVDGIVKYMDKFAKTRGYEGKYVDYQTVEVEDVAWAAIEEIQTWPCYNGEFDHVPMPESLGNPQ
jgi:hypothetical protein